MKSTILFLAFALAILVVAQDVAAQIPQSPPLPMLRAPRISQGAKVTQVVGLSEVTVYYHRPGVKGRKIFGPKGPDVLLPYGEVWRAGANEPTLFTFSDPVTIGGKRLGAGTYRFVVIPDQGEWTLVFNSEVKNWGTVYDAAYDTLRFKVKPQTGEREEWLTFNFTDLTYSSATVVVSWDNVRLPFKVEFDLLSKLQASAGSWQLLNGLARFAIDNKMYTTEAMAWVERSLALEKNFFNLRTKAELQALAGKTQDAIATAEEGLKLIKARDPKTLNDFQKQQIADTEKMVGEWKAKK